MRSEPQFDRFHLSFPDPDDPSETRLLQAYAPSEEASTWSTADFQKLEPTLQEIAGEYDVGSLTPRQMVNLSFDLYSSGFLSRDQYSELAFQSELMPNFDITIGALTGEKAQPDRPRDYTAVWRERVRFERTYCTEDLRIVERAENILKLLMTIKLPPKLKSRRRSAVERITNLPPLSLRGLK